MQVAKQFFDSLSEDQKALLQNVISDLGPQRFTEMILGRESAEEALVRQQKEEEERIKEEVRRKGNLPKDMPIALPDKSDPGPTLNNPLMDKAREPRGRKNPGYSIVPKTQPMKSPGSPVNTKNKTQIMPGKNDFRITKTPPASSMW